MKTLLALSVLLILACGSTTAPPVGNVIYSVDSVQGSVEYVCYIGPDGKMQYDYEAVLPWIMDIDMESGDQAGLGCKPDTGAVINIQIKVDGVAVVDGVASTPEACVWEHLLRMY